MVEAIARLLAESIDFSALAPPTDESVQEAVDRFLRHQIGRESWLMSRFTCPTKRLRELSRALEGRALTQPFPVVVAAGPSETPDEWEDQLSLAAKEMNDFDHSTADAIEIAAFEIQPPRCLEMTQVLRDLQGFSEVELYVDLLCESGSETLIAPLGDVDWAMVRLPASAPDVTAPLAALIHECLSLEVPFKLAGRRPPAITNKTQYGFLNLFGAVALAMSENLSRREIAVALSDEERTHWHFGSDSVGYRGWVADLASIDESRTLLLGFDACSVEGILDELSTTGLAVQRDR